MRPIANDPYRPQPRSLSCSASAMAETDHDRAFRHVAEAVQRVNEAVKRAVESGVTVELVRASRHHDGCGHWGDQMKPAVPESPWQHSRFSAASGAAMITEN